jgi:2-polyprenyl-6-methoxyphenol hydroxylase-like FAD-dependent oxidoreductase
VTRALIVGGGIAGLSAALALGELDYSVDLVERNDTVEALGSGITLITAAMRALERLGVLRECIDHGYGTSEVGLHDVDGDLLAVVPLPQALGSDVPGVMGMMRPTLHRILLDHAVSRGFTVRTGLSPEEIVDDEAMATVSFSDGSQREYDLVIGADGIRSTVREFVSGSLSAQFQHQVCYRAVVPRPASVTREIVFDGFKRVHIGFTPTGDDSMYIYCLVPADDMNRPPDAEIPSLIRGYLKPFGGVVPELCDHIADPALVNFTVLETIVAPKPWFRGRTTFVGDAAHSTTPHIAAGAAMCLEDALVLAEELKANENIAQALESYTTRRFDRCKFVVETSAQLGYWQTHPDTVGADPQALIGGALEVLSAPF